MKAFILITAIIELLAGAALFFAADKLPMLGHLDAGDFSLFKMYGAAAIAMGLFALSCWKNFSNEGLVSTFLSTFFIFHVGVALAAWTANTEGMIPDLSITALHGVLALFTGYFWLSNKG